MSICEDFAREMADIRVEKIYQTLNDKEKASMIKKLLGPLLDGKILTEKEAAFYFLHVAAGKSAKSIARSFRCSDQNVYRVIERAEEKLKAYRRERYRVVG